MARTGDVEVDINAMSHVTRFVTLLTLHKEGLESDSCSETGLIILAVIIKGRLVRLAKRNRSESL